MRRAIVFLLVAPLMACGGGASSPTAPTLPPPPAVNNWVLAGSIVDTLTGAPVAGATMTFAGYPAVTTNGDGVWELRGTGTAADRLTVTLEASSYLKRETRVTWNTAGRRDIRVDVIPDHPPFSLAFFRELVRNGAETPDALEPIRRWTSAPNFYVNTTNPRSGGSLAPSEIELIQRGIREGVRQVASGQFEAGAIELGTTSRDRRLGYINVIFVHEPNEDYCGRAFVGSNPGEITINYDRCRDECGAFSPDTLVHEVGHAMGLWHTKANGVMNQYGSGRCANFQFTPDELLHAKVAYARAPGNRDPDVDVGSFSTLQPGDPTRVVICRR